MIYSINKERFVTILILGQGSLDLTLFVFLVLPGENLRGGLLGVGVHVEASAPLLPPFVNTKCLSPKNAKMPNI